MTTKRMSEERLSQHQLDHLANIVAGHCKPSESDMHTNLRMALGHINTLRAELTAARTVVLALSPLDDVVHHLGIEESFTDPVEAIKQIERERDEARAALAKAREALERIANHPNANALILTGKPMIGVGTLARDVLATPTQESETP